MTDKYRNNDGRNIRFEIRLTADERQLLETHARARGMSSASLVRSAFLGYPLPDRRTGIEAEAIAALNRVGGNLNQIARVGNSNGTLTDNQIKGLVARVKALDGIAAKIREQVA